jgi:predicted N-formylglutamate amidohydrolase
MAQYSVSGNTRMRMMGDKGKRCINSVQNEKNESFEIFAAGHDSPWLVTCDHASNRVPDWVGGGDLGICGADMDRHIAYDVGAAALSRALAVALGCTAILSNFSRLVIDPNRGANDPTLLMRLYDGTIIPANRHVTEKDMNLRMDRLYLPYHRALARLAARRDDTVIVAVHSFTPCLKGRGPRPWHVGVLYSNLDARLSMPLLRRLNADPDLCVGDNEPYAGHLPGDAIDRHALATGRLNTLIEVRNDLIANPAAHKSWAERLVNHLKGALNDVRP